MKKILHRISLILAIITTGLSVKAAVDYKNELDRVLDESENTISVPPEIMLKVEEGNTLVYWIDRSGKKHYRTTENDLVGNL